MAIIVLILLLAELKATMYLPKVVVQVTFHLSSLFARLLTC